MSHSHMTWKPLPDHHRQRLEHHEQLLQKFRPELLHSLGNLHEYAHHLEIIEEDGNLIAARSFTQAAVRTLLPQEQGSILLQHQRTALHAPLERGARFLVISGIGVGHSLLMAANELDQYPTAGAIGWDPDPYAWTAFFALFDARKVIENTRHLFLFSGESIHEQVDDFIRERRLFLFPEKGMAFLLGALPVNPKYTERYVEQAKSLAHFLNQENLHFEPTLASFLDRINTPLSSTPQSVWSCVSRGAYIHYPIAQAFLEGFEQLGLTTHLEPFDDDFGKPMEVLGKFFEIQPDLLFSLNLGAAALLHDLGLPKETLESMQRTAVSWMVDDTLFYDDEDTTLPLGENDFVFCCDRTFLPRLQSQKCRSAFLPPATLFNQPGQRRDGFRADISYVGSLPDVRKHLDALPRACREMLERVETLRNQHITQPFLTLLDSLDPTPDQRQTIDRAATDFCNTISKGFTRLDSMVEYFLYNIATYLKRLNTIQALLPLGIAIYGPDTWRDALPSEYQDRYRGFVLSEYLADCYASSSICLNIHSHQCPTCLNIRDFDVPMAGSVVLGDFVEDAERGFLEPGKEMLTYRSLEEAVQLARQYLTDAQALGEMRMRGQERVMREHTFKHRAQSVLSALHA